MNQPKQNTKTGGKIAKCICGRIARKVYFDDEDGDWCGKPECAILLQQGMEATYE